MLALADHHNGDVGPFCSLHGFGNPLLSVPVTSQPRACVTLVWGLTTALIPSMTVVTCCKIFFGE